MVMIIGSLILVSCKGLKHMKIHKLFSQDKQLDKKSLFDCDIKIEQDNYFQVFSAALGKVMVNQNRCSELVVKERNWDIDFKEGIISFGTDKYPVQFIGSESSVSNTWLWGWANQSGLNDSVLYESRKLRDCGIVFIRYALEVMR